MSPGTARAMGIKRRDWMRELMQRQDEQKLAFYAMVMERKKGSVYDTQVSLWTTG